MSLFLSQTSNDVLSQVPEFDSDFVSISEKVKNVQLFELLVFCKNIFKFVITTPITSLYLKKILLRCYASIDSCDAVLMIQSNP